MLTLLLAIYAVSNGGLTSEELADILGKEAIRIPDSKLEIVYVPRIKTMLFYDGFGRFITVRSAAFIRNPPSPPCIQGHWRANCVHFAFFEGGAFGTRFAYTADILDKVTTFSFDDTGEIAFVDLTSVTTLTSRVFIHRSMELADDGNLKPVNRGQIVDTQYYLRLPFCMLCFSCNSSSIQFALFTK